MKNYLFFIIALILSSCVATTNNEKQSTQNLVNFVDPYIGSDYHGHVFVGANVPFGAVQLGPNNFYKGWDWCSAYHYSDSIVKGFSHTHLSGTGCTDLGDILIMPTTGELKVTAGTQENHQTGYASSYKHDNETVEAGYYSLILDRYNIKVELTTTERVGYHKYTFPESGQSRIIIDLEEGNADIARKTYLKQIDAQTVVGYRISDGWSMDQRVYFALQISKPFDEFLIFNDTIKQDGKESEGESLKGILGFKTSKDEAIMLKVGISPVSSENALQNITVEAPGWDFDEIHNKTKKLWGTELNKIKIKADNETSSRKGSPGLSTQCLNYTNKKANYPNGTLWGTTIGLCWVIMQFL